MPHGENIFRSFRSVVKNIVNDDTFFQLDQQEKLNAFSKNTELQKILKYMNGFICTFNYITGFYDFFSSGLTTNLGYKPEDFVGENGAQFVYEMMEPEHARFSIEVMMQHVLKYLSENATAETGLDYRFNSCLKLKDIHHVYKWFLIDTLMLEVNDTGFPTRTLITCTNIDAYKTDNLLNYNILKKDASQVYQVVLTGVANDPLSKSILTLRETETLILITHGFTNKMIADKLSITESTVKAHRRNIIIKTKCKGAVELTNFAFSRGWL